MTYSSMMNVMLELASQGAVERERKMIVSNVQGIAVITGASAGIGKVYADRLARRGYDLILVARRGDRLAAVAGEVQAAYGVKVETIVADLARGADLDRVAATVAANERITMLVNNAGIATLAPSVQIKAADVAAMNDLNVTALVRLTLAVLPGFIARDRGAIVNIASTLGFEILPVSTIYSATKGYVVNFTRGLQNELANGNVTVQLVTPGATATDLWDISGVPLSALDAGIVMRVEHAVDAALAGLDLKERVTMPSVEDASLLAAYDKTRVALFGGSQSGKPASRYAIAR
jgi:uncharacterized protein